MLLELEEIRATLQAKRYEQREELQGMSNAMKWPCQATVEEHLDSCVMFSAQTGVRGCKAWQVVYMYEEKDSGYVACFALNMAVTRFDVQVKVLGSSDSGFGELNSQDALVCVEHAISTALLGS